SLASGYAHPDPGWRIPGVLQLRDETGKVADGFDAASMTLTAPPGVVTEPLRRIAPGFYRFAVAARSETGGDTLHVAASYRNSDFLQKDIPIAVDANVAREGFSARGGCAIEPRGARAPLA